MKRLAILGSTGSIGCSALAVVEAYPDRLQVLGLAAGANASRFAEQVARFRPRVVTMATAASLTEARQALAGTADLQIQYAGTGREGLTAVATHPEVDIVLCASSGTAALDAVLAAIETGKTIALANKEVLVMAGALVMAAARRRGVPILPVDSEHNAVHQCLHGRSAAEVRRLVLTASGGPFRDVPLAELSDVSPEDALRHPTWRMGPKITIDSATMMNKGLEVIEAHWLFEMPPDRIEVVVHPQSIVHSMVELVDGSVIAQLGVTDMKLPIQYAFSYPERWGTTLPALDLIREGPLEFAEPDLDRFPCLRLAYRALEAGGVAPLVLNTANEVAVGAFLGGTLGFTGIPRLIGEVLEGCHASRLSPPASLEDVRHVERWARRYSQDRLSALQSNI
jgi:1-deoxy-D-xylulose-5-phosphate reductoisomerase